MYAIYYTVWLARVINLGLHAKDDVSKPAGTDPIACMAEIVNSHMQDRFGSFLHTCVQERCGVQQQYVGAYLEGQLPPSALVQDASQQNFLQQAQHDITSQEQVKEHCHVYMERHDPRLFTKCFFFYLTCATSIRKPAQQTWHACYA